MDDDDRNPFLDDLEEEEAELLDDEAIREEKEKTPAFLAVYAEDELTEEIQKDKIEPSPPWLVSMGDVTALMLTFFVMLFSMSELKSENYDAVISLISTSTKPSRLEKPQPVSELNVDTTSVLSALSTDYLNQIFRKKMEAEPALAAMKVTALPDQMIISLPSDSLFAPGSSDLASGARDIITAMSSVLAQVGNQVEVVGHTDPMPPEAGAVYPTNWELSLARSVTVANALTNAGYPGRMVTLGMADSRYKHLDRDIPEERRYELARRVDIVILSEAGGQ
ncbi:MAG: flagellar motor protein MotB [Alphaproteobacteria bacterium]